MLDTPQEECFDRLIRLAVSVFGVPSAAVSLVDSDREFYKACQGVDTREGDRKVAFCAHAILHDEVFIVEDATRDPRFADNPQVTEGGVRFYAGAPLRTHDGLNIGSFCIRDVKPRTLSEEQIGMLRTLAEITVDELELRLSGERLRTARDEARSADRAKSVFLSNMSHEIRTPLTSIIGYADLLQEIDREAPEFPVMLETIRRNGEHLQGLVGDVLDLSKIESGAMSLEAEPFDLCETVAGCVAAVGPSAERKGLELTVRVPPTPVAVTGDVTRYRQILMNLLGNAVKFTHEGGVSIECACEPLQDGRRRTLVRVTDTGCGIAAEAMGVIFSPFAQEDSSITRRFGGTGLGLAISRQLAHLMGGTLGVRSRRGEGSTFTLDIPFPAAAVTTLRQELPSDHASLDGMAVLLAEDCPDNQRLLRFVLERVGVRLTVVEHGKAALDRLATGLFDLVLMDMQMPVMDGVTALRELRAAGNTVPVVMLTANVLPADRARCRDAGCDAFLTKPIDRDMLYRTCAAYARPAAA